MNKRDNADDLTPIEKMLLRMDNEGVINLGPSEDDVCRDEESVPVPVREETLRGALAAVEAGALDRKLATAAQAVGPRHAKEPLGEYLARVRAAAGIGWEAWAERLDVEPASLQDVELADQSLTLLRSSAVAAILDAVNVTMNSFRQAVLAVFQCEALSPARSAGQGAVDAGLGRELGRLFSEVEDRLDYLDREDLLGRSQQ